MSEKEMAEKLIGLLLLVSLGGLVLAIFKDSHVVAIILIPTTLWLWAMYIADGLRK